MTADKSKIYYTCIPSCKSITHCEDAEQAESLQIIQITWTGIPSPRSATLYQFIMSCQYCTEKCNICCVANWMDWNTSSHLTHVFASPVAPFSLRQPTHVLRLARRPVFASPVAPSSPRPSPRLRLTRRPVFASPVARLRLTRRSVSASPVVPSSPRPSSRLRLTFLVPLYFVMRSGSAVLPNGLYAMGGTVAQAVWLKVDRRGNAPVGTSPLSMWWWLPGKLGGIEPLTSGTLVKCFAAEPTITY
ncbi:hypothetical protein OUZ56_024983 [Daphnia magna]|uniref:Uncharacterized protein n=1 Tax=Daphnia magna TaxID=35525 RepID=A0ABQ9ZIK3_9CRUS|nr:hypothetical protein OUZ56_024983 [Daphnia magna]